ERWLAGRLRAAGGELETFPTALSPHDGIRVTTPWEGREAALAVIREIATGLEPASPSACFRLDGRASGAGFGMVLLLATDETGLDGPPGWLAASWGDHGYGRYRFSAWPTPIGAHMVRPSNDLRRVLLLGTGGEVTSVDLPSLESQVLPPAFHD